MTNERGGRPSKIATPVFLYLQRNVGLPVHLDDLAKDTGLTHRQILSALSTLRTRRGFDIETIVSGQIYRLVSLQTTPVASKKQADKPAAAASRRFFQEVGTMRDGTLVIQGDDDQLYRADLL